jgi:hypothetical protein
LYIIRSYKNTLRVMIGRWVMSLQVRLQESSSQGQLCDKQRFFGRDDFKLLQCYTVPWSIGFVSIELFDDY